MLAPLQYLSYNACFQNRSTSVISDRYKQSTGVRLFFWGLYIGMQRGVILMLTSCCRYTLPDSRLHFSHGDWLAGLMDFSLHVFICSSFLLSPTLIEFVHLDFFFLYHLLLWIKINCALSVFFEWFTLNTFLLHM